MNYWIAMHYNSGKRTVIGVLNHVDGKPVIVHQTVNSQWHHQSTSPGAIDIGLLNYMNKEGIDLFVNQTAKVKISRDKLNALPVEARPILTGPFKGLTSKRVYAPLDQWEKTDIGWSKPDKLSDEISLDEDGNVWSVGVDTR